MSGAHPTGMKIVTISLAMALGFSLLVHAVTLYRMNRPAPEAAVARPAVRAVAAPTPREPESIVMTPQEIPEPAGAPVAPVPMEAVPSPIPARDPELTRILAEQDRWNALLADLGKLASARRHQMIGDERYAQGVIEFTADFLSMREPQRGAFIESARIVVADLERARGEMELVMRADPRPAREQMQAAAAKYRAVQGAAQERLTAQLDLQQPQQKQFGMQLPQWMRSLGSPDGRWSGP